MWLMKSEPDVYSIRQLKKDKTTWWSGVRNYQARNSMKEMKVGDQVLFYHSSTMPPGIAGIAKISKLAVPDETQFDKKSDYFDPKATADKPIWFCTQVQFVTEFKTYVSLADLRASDKLKDLLVLQKGSRLSIQPVSKTNFEVIKKMGGL